MSQKSKQNTKVCHVITSPFQRALRVAFLLTPTGGLRTGDESHHLIVVLETSGSLRGTLHTMSPTWGLGTQVLGSPNRQPSPRGGLPRGCWEAWCRSRWRTDRRPFLPPSPKTESPRTATTGLTHDSHGLDSRK